MPKKQKTLATEVTAVLRTKVHEMESQLNRYKTLQAQAENENFKLARRVNSAEQQSEVLLNAVRMLAEAVPNTTASGRTARAKARSLLELHKIRPPHTLGSTRTVKTKRKRGLTSKVPTGTPVP